MVGYDDANNALTLGDDDSLEVGDYELKYNSTDDEWHAEYGRPIGGELGNHGEILGAEYSPDSQIGDNATKFDGNSTIETNLREFGSSNGFTISFWGKASTSHNGVVLSTNKDSTEDDFDFRLIDSDDGNVASVFLDQFSVHLFGTTALNDGEYHNIVWTSTSSGSELYVDGVSEDTSTDGENTLSPSSGLSIGGPTGRPLYKGLADDIRVYDRALSASEVTDLYNGVDVTDGLVAQYDFEYPETPEVAIDSTGDAFPKNSVPRSTSGSLVPQGLAESVSAGEALADDGDTYSSVQTAVDNASGWVFVGPGTFNESVTISTAGLTLEGCGYNTLIDGGTATDTISAEASNVTIKSLRAEKDSGSGGQVVQSTSGASNVTISDVTITEGDGRTILLRGSDSSIIRCNVDGSIDGAGVQVDGVRSIVSNSTIKNTSGDGMETGADDCIVSNCIIDSCNENIKVNSDDNIVIGCRSSNATSDGIVLQSGTADNIVANSRFSDNGDSDINDSGTNTTLDGNLTGASN